MFVLLLGMFLCSVFLLVSLFGVCTRVGFGFGCCWVLWASLVIPLSFSLLVGLEVDRLICISRSFCRALSGSRGIQLCVIHY